MVEVKQQYNRSKNKERKKKMDVEIATAVVKWFQQNVKGRGGQARAV